MKDTLLRIAAPSALDMLQADHEHVTRMFHEYRADAPARQRTTVVRCIAVAIEVHSVLEEETVLMPEARVLLRARLHDLGATMARRRIELLAPRTAELLSNAVGSVPAAFGVFAGGAMAGASMAFRHVFAR